MDEKDSQKEEIRLYVLDYKDRYVTNEHNRIIKSCDCLAKSTSEYNGERVDDLFKPGDIVIRLPVDPDYTSLLHMPQKVTSVRILPENVYKKLKQGYNKESRAYTAQVDKIVKAAGKATAKIEKDKDKKLDKIKKPLSLEQRILKALNLD